MIVTIGRRELLVALGGAAVAWPLAAGAQQPEGTRRIGVLGSFPETDAEGQARIAALRKRLQDLGWTEGRNIRLDLRWSSSDADLVRKFAKELVDLQPNLIVTESTPLTAAVLHETRTIPIVFVQVGDPVGSGIVTSMPHPGGNATGVTNFPVTITSKWLELLKEIAPRIVRVAFLFHPATAPYAQRYLDPFQAAASSIGVQAVVSPVQSPTEIETVIAGLTREATGGLVVLPSAFMATHRDSIVALAARYRIPAVYPYRFYAASGGLVSYGNNAVDAYRQSADYVDRILRGAKPTELPVQLPVKYELVVNLTTAKALGLDVPLHIQQLADEVIE